MCATGPARYVSVSDEPGMSQVLTRSNTFGTSSVRSVAISRP